MSALRWRIPAPLGRDRHPRRLHRRPDLRERNSLHPRRRHAAQLHPGQHQGLVQKQLRGRQPAPHQHRQQPPPLRRHPAHQRRARRADRAEDPRHQARAAPWSRSSSTRTTPATATPGPCSASCSSSSSATATDTYYFANNNARHFAFNADERFSPSTSSPTADNTKITPPRRLRRQLPPQVHARPDDQPLHGAHRQRAEAPDDAPVPDLCRQGTSSSASSRTAATATSGTPPAAARRSPPSRPPRSSRTTRHRQMPLRRGPQGPRPADAGRVHSARKTRFGRRSKTSRATAILPSRSSWKSLRIF